MIAPASALRCVVCARPEGAVDVFVPALVCVICGYCAEAAAKEARFLRAQEVVRRTSMPAPLPFRCRLMRRAMSSGERAEAAGAARQFVAQPRPQRHAAPLSPHLDPSAVVHVETYPARGAARLPETRSAGVSR